MSLFTESLFWVGFGFGAISMVLAFAALLYWVTQLPDIEPPRFCLKVEDCTRPEGHDGPCNGWPCETARKAWPERGNIYRPPASGESRDR